MTLLDPSQMSGAPTDQGIPEAGTSLERQQREQEQASINVGGGERAVSVAAGSILAMLGVSRRSIPGLILAGVGGAMVYRGATGHCAIYEKLGIDSKSRGGSGLEQDLSRGVQVEQALSINRSPEELYQYWRNFENLPRIMSYLEEVRVQDGGRSHWVARAPRIAGGRVEWDAEITRDEPNRLIAWRSLSGSDIDTVGEVRFEPGRGDRGTEVHVSMRYVPPAGRLGHYIASMLGQNPKRTIREDLRNFKRIMEIGEILTIVGQPHGTCTGQGKPYDESQWKPHFA